MTTAKKLDTKTINVEEKAIAYLRVSTSEQKKKGLSIDYQRSMAIKYVEQYNSNIDKNNDISGASVLPRISEKIDFYEEAKKASDSINDDEDIYIALKKRPEFKKIIELSQQKRFKHLIVLSHDRLVRNFEQFIILKDILIRNGVTIHYSRPGESFGIGDTSIGRFLDNILASVAELEINVLGVRVKAGGRTCALIGRWPGGRPPAGYTLENIKVPDKKRKIALLKINNEEQEKVKRIYKLYAEGYGYREIAKKMNHDDGSNRWKKSNVEKVLKNATYTGRITWNRRSKTEGNKEEIIQSKYNKNIEIIDESSWRAVNELRCKKTQNRDPYYYNTRFILKGKLYCNLCGKPLATRDYGMRSDGKKYLVYRCNSNSSKKSHFSFPAEEIEKEILEKITKQIQYDDFNILWETYFKEQNEYHKNLISSKVKLNKEINEVNRLKKNLRAVISYMDEEIKKKVNKDESGCTEVADNNIEIKDKLNIHAFLLDKTLEKYEIEMNKVEEFLKDYKPDTKEQFFESLRAVNQEILDSKNTTLKRMYIDELIDKIILTNPGDSLDEVNIKILLKPSKKL